MNEVLAWENPCSATVGWLLVSTTAPVGQPGQHCLLCSLFRTEVSGNSFLLLPSLDDSWVDRGMATHSSVLAWRIPGTGEPGGLLSLGSHRVGLK